MLYFHRTNNRSASLFLFLVIIILALLVGSFILFKGNNNISSVVNQTTSSINNINYVASSSQNSTGSNASTSTPATALPSIISTTTTPKIITTPANILISVPFASQAPLAEWSDYRFQNACEEVSVLMAMKWINNQSIPNTKAAKQAIHDEIIKITDYEDKNFGGNTDTSINDTAVRILAGYYNYNNYKILDNIISADDIIAELQKGNILIIAMNGQKLHNPNFSGAGPEHHMLVVKGYDFQNQLFITNDPGTRKGESYPYTPKVLFDAIADYPTGDHLHAASIIKKAIVVSK